VSSWTCDSRHRADDRWSRGWRARLTSGYADRRSRLAAGVAGFGLSAVFDVVVRHTILQLHHLVSNVYSPNTLAGLRTNVFADGVFTLATLAVAVAGGRWPFRAERRTPALLGVRPHVGAAVVGLGLFGLFGVLADHWLLGLHHATHGPRFLGPHWAVLSVAVVVGGFLLYRG
jgi:uncharacterized membrane protein